MHALIAVLPLPLPPRVSNGSASFSRSLIGHEPLVLASCTASVIFHICPNAGVERLQPGHALLLPRELPVDDAAALRARCRRTHRRPVVHLGQTRSARGCPPCSPAVSLADGTSRIRAEATVVGCRAVTRRPGILVVVFPLYFPDHVDGHVRSRGSRSAVHFGHVVGSGSRRSTGVSLPRFCSRASDCFSGCSCIHVDIPSGGLELPALGGLDNSHDLLLVDRLVSR
mmetsp:Transcript_36054/g.89976  ORF Transcript_36054/g.89976 Transcript_36054/m.89976 type:complete len:227 (-) Transcript_36054:88-768(-)